MAARAFQIVCPIALLVFAFSLIGAAVSAAKPGPFSTPFANPETPVIVLHVGQTMTYASTSWRAGQRVRCTGNGDALDSGIPGFLGVPALLRTMRLRYPLTLRVNHGLKLALVMAPDHSISVTCST